MNREIDFGPTIYLKEDDTMNSALVVDNGPRLMKKDKVYTEIFDELIENFPSVLTVTFYNKTYTSYRIKFEGARDPVIFGVKCFLSNVE